MNTNPITRRRACRSAVASALFLTAVVPAAAQADGGDGDDTLIGDEPASDCGIRQSRSLPQGNDVIAARDGERVKRR